ncbi:AfsR/SARP family transcriptional regulator, partial [Actinoplanes philippinensis]|uniref:AfsR/SARP family transcriptional regulator n=1 Tax=Actinoplanes philippinensis TaxID=35752 RepID=UPI0033EF60DA
MQPALRFAVLITAVRAAADRDPLDEPLQAGLMLLLSAAGRQAEALTVYHRVRTLLADDLGIDPGAELSDAHTRILQTSPTGVRQPPAPADRPFPNTHPSPMSPLGGADHRSPPSPPGPADHPSPLSPLGAADHPSPPPPSVSGAHPSSPLPPAPAAGPRTPVPPVTTPAARATFAVVARARLGRSWLHAGVARRSDRFGGVICRFWFGFCCGFRGFGRFGFCCAWRGFGWFGPRHARLS